jgi:hypothetical protein
MKNQQNNWNRLVALAQQPAATPGAMPPGFADRVLAGWRPGPSVSPWQQWEALAPRALALALLLAVVIAGVQLTAPDRADRNEQLASAIMKELLAP